MVNRGTKIAALALFLSFSILVKVAAAQATFSQTGSMSTTRIYATLTRLPDGRVLSAAGGNPELNTSEIYDPATGLWTPTGNLNDARGQGHATLLLKTGKVLTMGGHGASLGSAELYDPLTGVWTRTGSLVSPRYSTAAVLLNDGKVLMFGGALLNASPSTITTTAEIYDPATGLWSGTGSMQIARYASHKGVVLKDGRVLVVGGHGSGPQAEIFSPSTGTWALTDTIPFNVDETTLTLLPDGRVLVTAWLGHGGYGSSSGAAIYDPTSGLWTSVASPPGSRTGDSATLLLDGTVFLAGPTGCLIFDPVALTWTDVVNSSQLVGDIFGSNNPGVLLLDGRVLVASYANNQAFLFTGVPALTMSVTAPSSLSVVNGAYSPNPFTITATISNIGAAGAQQVTASLNLPSGLTLQPGSNPVQAIGLLAPGQQTQVQWNVQAAGQTQPVTPAFSVRTDSVNATTVSVQRQISLPAGVLPHLTIAKSHSGTFTQGHQNATYTVIVSNASTATSTTGTVTVTDSIPTGLTLISMAGNGWTCPGTSGSTCTRSDALPPGSSYPSLTVTVNVAVNAPAQLTNQVSVSGGGSAAANASDITLISQAATIISPAPGSTLPPTTATFNWTAPAGAAQYWFDIGNSPGSAEFTTGATTGTTRTVTNIPCDGRTLYATLYTDFSGIGNWVRPPQVTAYKTALCPAPTPIPGLIISPTPGSTLAGSTVTFTWNTGVGVSQFWFDIGNSPGSAEFTTGATTATSKTVSSLPCDGRTLYATVYVAYTGNNWQRPPLVTMYKAASACQSPAQMISPAAGSTLGGTSVIFTWTPGLGSAQYWLDIGNSPGSAEFTTGATTSTSKTVRNLPCDGRTLYATLYTDFSGLGNWQRPPQVTIFKALPACSPTPAQMTYPAAGSTLTGPSATFNWASGFGAAQYWLDVGNSPGSAEFSTGATNALTRTVNNLPCDGRTLYATLYTDFTGAGNWQHPPQVTIYKASNTSCPSPNAPAHLISINVSGSTATFNWTTGTGAIQYWLDVGNSPGSAEFTTGATTATSRTVTGLPCDGRPLYATLYTAFTGSTWQRPPEVTPFAAAPSCTP